LSVGWAAAEGVSETVIATILLLEVRSVGKVVLKLTACELEQIIKLVKRRWIGTPIGVMPIHIPANS
jgi:hypothetical protein